MLEKIQGYLGGVAALLFLTISLGNLYGLYRVHDKLQQAENLRVDAVKEKAFQVVNEKLDDKIQTINDNTKAAQTSLKEILDDAKSMRPTVQQAAPVVVHVAAPPPQAAPGPVGAQTPSPGPSSTAVRTIDVLWTNFCANFPKQPGCPGGPPQEADMPTDPSAVQGSGQPIQRP